MMNAQGKCRSFEKCMKMREYMSRWFGHFIGRNDVEAVRVFMNLNVEGKRRRRRPKNVEYRILLINDDSWSYWTKCKRSRSRVDGPDGSVRQR